MLTVPWLGWHGRRRGGPFRLRGGAVESVLGIAKGIATPLSLGALAILILFGLFRLLLERLPIDTVIPDHVYRILMRVITYVFVVALVGLCLGILAYVAPPIVEKVLSRRDLTEGYALLTSPERAQRVAGIAALQSAGLASPEAAGGVCAALSAFVRSAGPSGAVTEGKLNDDVQAAVEVLSGLLRKGRCGVLDLAKSDLRRLQLPKGFLREARLTGARLEEANLRGGDLEGATLTGAVLRDAVLAGADLGRAVLQGVQWGTADLSGAGLTGAVGLAGADLRKVVLAGAVMESADLRQVRLPAEVTKVSFAGSDLRDVDLGMVHGLCRWQVEGAQIDATTRGLPASYAC